MRGILTVMLLVSSIALADDVAGQLFVKADGTKLLKAPKKGAATVLTLSCGDKVTWDGPSTRDKNFQSVTTAAGKKGFVLATELTEQVVPFSKCGFTQDQNMGSGNSEEAEAKFRQGVIDGMQRALQADGGTRSAP